MAIDSYMCFQDYDGKWLPSESQVSFANNSGEPLMKEPWPLAPAGSVFEIDDYSFDVEQTLNIGSQSSGTGAGRITFNPFSFTRKVDVSSARFFEMACSGTAFKYVSLVLRKGSGTSVSSTGASSGSIFLRFDFKLVAVKTVSWSHDDEAPKEEVTFEYGGFQIRYAQQLAGNKFAAAQKGGWNRVQNVKDQDAAEITTTAVVMS